MSGLQTKAPFSHDKLSDPFLNPFSLKKNFGKRFKVMKEESWAIELPENRRNYEGWYEQIPCCCGGFIALHRHRPTVILEFFTSRQRITCRKLAEQFKDNPDIYLDDRFDGFETIFRFPLEFFLVVAEAVGARKRRQGRPLTDVQKIAFTEGRKKGMAALKRRRNSLLSVPPETPG